MVTQDQYLAEVFKQPPLTAYRRQTNLRDLLIKSRVPPIPKHYPNRVMKGMFKCNKLHCTSCPYINTGSKVNIHGTKYWNINRKVSCDTFNCVYLIECQKDSCKPRYIGQTGRLLKHRLSDHRGYVINKVVSKATGAHYNLPGHSLADMRITILEQIKNNNIEYRKDREKYFIRLFNTYNNESFFGIISNK